MPNTLNWSNLPSSGETKAPQVNWIWTQTKEISEVLKNPEEEVRHEINDIFFQSFSELQQAIKDDDRHWEWYVIYHLNGNAKKMYHNEEIKESLIMSLWSDLHEEWRKGRLREDGTYEPRWKPAEDDKWSESHGWAEELDIANTKFEDLSPKWQKSNYEAAKFVIDLVYDSVISVHYPVPRHFDEKISYRDVFNFEAIESFASEVHEDWMRRNSWDIKSRPELFVPYSELPEEEKLKDRRQVLQAIRKVEAKAQARR